VLESIKNLRKEYDEDIAKFVDNCTATLPENCLESILHRIRNSLQMNLSTPLFLHEDRLDNYELQVILELLETLFRYIKFMGSREEEQISQIKKRISDLMEDYEYRNAAECSRVKNCLHFPLMFNDREGAKDFDFAGDERF
jgi:hypothetical protein